MKLTQLGKDLILVDESNLKDKPSDKKIHIIKLSFAEPTYAKVMEILKLHPETNRFVIGDHVKEYNSILRDSGRKYYVQNKQNVSGLFSFFRKNNKVLLSVPSLLEDEKDFVLNRSLQDVLKNLEIIMISKKDYENRVDNFKHWNGNVVLWDGEHEYL